MAPGPPPRPNQYPIRRETPLIAVPEAVSYDVTPDDLVRLQQQGPAPKLNRIVAWVLLVCVLAGAAWKCYTDAWNADPQHAKFWQVYLITCGVALAAFFIPPWLSPRRMAKQHASKPGALGPQSASVSEDGLRVTAADGERCVPWSEISQVDRTADLVILQPQDGFAYVIPRRAFSSPEAADSFYQSARDWHAAAKSSASA